MYNENQSVINVPAILLGLFSVIERLKEIMSEVEISINALKEDQRSW